MKNAEKAIRGSHWRGPGVVKKIDSWRNWEKSEERRISYTNEKGLNDEKGPKGKKFKKWNMPDQQEGYIKSKKHDFL
jgi:hypothetical protein